MLYVEVLGWCSIYIYICMYSVCKKKNTKSTVVGNSVKSLAGLLHQLCSLINFLGKLI